MLRRLPALLGLALALATAPAGPNAPTDLRTVTVIGLQIGMTPDQALPLIKQKFGTVRVSHVPCMADYIAAIRNHAQTAATKCVGAIYAGAPPFYHEFHALFVEDFPARPGTTGIALIRYVQPVQTQAEAEQFKNAVLAKYGAPSINGPVGFDLRYCNGLIGDIACNDFDSDVTPAADIKDVDAGMVPDRATCTTVPANPQLFLSAEASAPGDAVILLSDRQLICSKGAAMKRAIESITGGVSL